MRAAFEAGGHGFQWLKAATGAIIRVPDMGESPNGVDRDRPDVNNYHENVICGAAIAMHESLAFPHDRDYIRLTVRLEPDATRSLPMTINQAITYGDHTIDFAALPEASVRAILSRGVTHFLGNEQSAKVGPNSSWVAKFTKENGRAPTEDEVTAQRKLNIEKAIEALVAGSVGTARGPKVDPIEAEMDRIAEREVWDILSSQNPPLCKKNKKPKDEDEFTFADGTKLTFGTMVERRLSPEKGHVDRITKEATKKVEAEKRAREKTKAEAAKAAAGGPVESAEQLGL